MLFTNARFKKKNKREFKSKIKSQRGKELWWSMVLSYRSLGIIISYPVVSYNQLFANLSVLNNETMMTKNIMQTRLQKYINSKLEGKTI